MVVDPFATSSDAYNFTYVRCVIQLSSFFLCFVLAFDFLSVLRGHSAFSMTSDFEGFSIPDCIHYNYFPILILEKEPVFSLLNVQCY